MVTVVLHFLNLNLVAVLVVALQLPLFRQLDHHVMEVNALYFHNLVNLVMVVDA